MARHVIYAKTIIYTLDARYSQPAMKPRPPMGVMAPEK